MAITIQQLSKIAAIANDGPHADYWRNLVYETASIANDLEFNVEKSYVNFHKYRTIALGVHRRPTGALMVYSYLGHLWHNDWDGLTASAVFKLVSENNYTGYRTATAQDGRFWENDIGSASSINPWLVKKLVAARKFWNIPLQEAIDATKRYQSNYHKNSKLIDAYVVELKGARVKRPAVHNPVYVKLAHTK